MDAATLERSVDGVVETALALVSTWGLSVVGAIAVLIVGRIVAGSIRSGVRRGLERAGTDGALVPFLSSLAYYGALTVVVIAVLNLFGIQTTSLVAVLGAAGLAVGLALQGTLSNFAAGTMLLVFRPIRLGDYVEVAGVAGSVVEIGIFTTTLNTPDNVRIICPNTKVYGDIITNYSANERRRIDLVLGVGYGDDLGVALDAIERVVKADERVLAEPAPTIEVAELGDSSVDIVVRPWVASGDYWPTRFALMRALKEGVEAAGCSIPFPQRDVHVIEMPQRAS
ncbi:MAG: mechanosensitive ion channel [Myxococcota bacterium]